MEEMTMIRKIIQIDQENAMAAVFVSTLAMKESSLTVDGKAHSCATITATA